MSARVADMLRALEGQTPWEPGYVPFDRRPSCGRLFGPHVVLPGYVAFYLDPEVGVAGVRVLSIAQGRARVTFVLARDETAEQVRRGERNVHMVPVSELRDTFELAQLASWGRNLVTRAAA